LYFQYRKGLLEEEDWAVYRRNLKSNMSGNPVARNVYISASRPISELIQILATAKPLPDLGTGNAGSSKQDSDGFSDLAGSAPDPARV
jgi:hypothetical protein